MTAVSSKPNPRSKKDLQRFFDVATGHANDPNWLVADDAPRSSPTEPLFRHAIQLSWRRVTDAEDRRDPRRNRNISADILFGLRVGEHQAVSAPKPPPAGPEAGMESFADRPTQPD
jgi:hypothetical protein